MPDQDPRAPPDRTYAQEDILPSIRAGSITMHYEQQGSGEPLILIPYLAADHACYAFQVADYAKRFTCISVDLRGTIARSALAIFEDCSHVPLYENVAPFNEKTLDFLARHAG